MSDLVVGLDGLVEYTKIGKNRLRRAFKLDGFPPYRELRDGKALRRAWDRNEVLDWLLEHRDRPWYAEAFEKKIAASSRLE